MSQFAAKSLCAKEIVALAIAEIETRSTES